MTPEKIVRRLMDLQELLFEFHAIQRHVYLPEKPNNSRSETDTEHTYSLAMTAWYLCGHFPDLDTDKVIRYALAHDLVEIHAGDVMAIGRTDEQQSEKEAKEAEAVAQLKEEWPDFNDMTTSIEEYEKQTDREAVFVKTLDKIMAPMVNIHAKGKLWKEYGIRREDVIANKDEKTKHSAEVHELWQVLRQHILDHDEWFSSNDEHTSSEDSQSKTSPE